MEIIVGSILCIIIISLSLLGINYANKKDEEFIYVHIKTGNKYRIIQECLMKYSGKWVDAVIYTSEDTYEVYVREYDDFVINFKTLSEWKKQQLKKTM